jgi:hypothetical protein
MKIILFRYAAQIATILYDDCRRRRGAPGNDR